MVNLNHRKLLNRIEMRNLRPSGLVILFSCCIDFENRVGVLAFYFFLRAFWQSRGVGKGDGIVKLAEDYRQAGRCPINNSIIRFL